jgi:hypothetical protein
VADLVQNLALSRCASRMLHALLYAMPGRLTNF